MARDLPNTPGIYWFRSSPDAEWSIVRAHRFTAKGVLHVCEYHPHFAGFAAPVSSIMESNPAAEFAGPIRPPEPKAPDADPDDPQPGS